MRKNVFFLLKAVHEAAAFRSTAEWALIWEARGPGSENRPHPSEFCYSFSLLFSLCQIGTVPFSETCGYSVR